MAFIFINFLLFVIDFLIGDGRNTKFIWMFKGFTALELLLELSLLWLIMVV